MNHRGRDRFDMILDDFIGYRMISIFQDPGICKLYLGLHVRDFLGRV